MSAAPTLILSAPQGWDKAVHAEQLRVEYGCASIVDEWHPKKGTTDGALHLTHIHPDDLLCWGVNERQIRPVGWSDTHANLSHHQHGRIDVYLLLGNAGVWTLAGIVAIFLGAAHYLDHWKGLFGPDDVATAQLVADDLASAQQADQQAALWRQQVQQAIAMACKPHTGHLNGNGDIQCTGPDGRPSFYVYLGAKS